MGDSTQHVTNSLVTLRYRFKYLKRLFFVSGTVFFFSSFSFILIYIYRGTHTGSEENIESKRDRARVSERERGIKEKKKNPRELNEMEPKSVMYRHDNVPYSNTRPTCVCMRKRHQYNATGWDHWAHNFVVVVAV